MVSRAWANHKEGWARAYFVLLNNGKLKYYESAAAAAMPAKERVEVSCSECYGGCALAIEAQARLTARIAPLPAAW